MHSYFPIAETDNAVNILFYIFTLNVFTILLIVRKINLKMIWQLTLFIYLHSIFVKLIALVYPRDIFSLFHSHWVEQQWMLQNFALQTRFDIFGYFRYLNIIFWVVDSCFYIKYGHCATNNIVNTVSSITYNPMSSGDIKYVNKFRKCHAENCLFLYKYISQKKSFWFD